MRSELALFERVGSPSPVPAPERRVPTAPERRMPIAPERRIPTAPPSARPVAGRGARPVSPRSRPLRIVDLALTEDDLGRGMRNYLAAKSERARRVGTFEHHVVLAARTERHTGGLHELPATKRRLGARQRPALRFEGLDRTLRSVAPDVVLLHERGRRTAELQALSDDVGARLVAVGHDGAADAVPLRRGLHPVFHPGRHVTPRRHVLFAGRLEQRSGVATLLDAAALAGGAWKLRIVGEGPEHGALRRHARALGLGPGVAFVPYVRDRERFARYLAEASCVVVPGADESFGLVALEAAACATPVVCCSTAPVAAVLGDLAETFAPADAEGLAAAIARARERPRDLLGAARLAAEHAWDAVLAAEQRDVESLVR